MKKKFKMSAEDLQSILNASKPVPYIIVGNSLPSSPQENANRAWEAVGKKLGFKWDTAEPADEGDDTVFLAEPLS